MKIWTTTSVKYVTKLSCISGSAALELKLPQSCSLVILGERLWVHLSTRGNSHLTTLSCRTMKGNDFPTVSSGTKRKQAEMKFICDNSVFQTQHSNRLPPFLFFHLQGLRHWEWEVEYQKISSAASCESLANSNFTLIIFKTVVLWLSFWHIIVPTQ